MEELPSSNRKPEKYDRVDLVFYEFTYQLEAVLKKMRQAYINSEKVFVFSDLDVFYHEENKEDEESEEV